MFETVRIKSGLFPLALVVGAAAGAFIAKSGASFVQPAFAASVLETSGQTASHSAVQNKFDSLLKIGNNNYRIHVDDSVDLRAKKTAHVKKISGGKVTNINIAFTPTGTYSTDGFRSKNVLYPGIQVEHVEPLITALNSSLANFSLAETQRLQNYFPKFDAFLQSQADDNGCISDTSYIACK